MRGDALRRIRSVAASTAMVSSFLVAAVATAALSTGCRSAGGGARVDPDPTLNALVAPAEAAEIAALPEGAGRTLVAERCLMCHSAALISQQRKDAAAWGRTLTQMRTWGTPIQDAEQAALTAYLVEHFGPRGAPR